MGILSTTADRFMGLFGYVRPEAQTGPRSAYAIREIGYRFREKLYDNTAYLPRARGGCVEDLLRYELGLDRCNVPVVGVLNPVREIVGCYGNLFPGTWGDGMALAPKVGRRDVHPALLSDDDPVGTIWRGSSFDTEKSKLLMWGPNLGTVGIRVYVRDDADRQAVYLKLDHPSRIARFEEDDRGNVTAVRLKYHVPDPNDDVRSDSPPQMVEVEELLTKDDFSRKYDGVEQLDDGQRRNELGVCPYVILRHIDNGDPWGHWAYVGSESIIHQVNYLFALLPKSLRKAAFAKWFATAGGNAPQNFDLGEESVAYVKTEPNSPPPSLEPLVPRVDYAGILAAIERMVKALRERQPEMNLNDIDVVPTISGEALAQFLKPIQARILEARPNYDAALTRALQIGLSQMVVMGTLDVGTGQGPKAADAAYHRGLLDFAFADRPPLPLSTFEKTQRAQADRAAETVGVGIANDAAAFVGRKEQLRLAGYDDRKAEELLAEQPALLALQTQADAANAQGGASGGGPPDPASMTDAELLAELSAPPGGSP